MRVDYTKLFATPDELADFLLLDIKEQDRIMFNLTMSSKIQMTEIHCDRGKRRGALENNGE